MTTTITDPWQWSDTEHQLPPGQRAVAGFPRFGKEMGPPPPVPEHPTLTVSGPLAEPIVLGLADLAELPQVEREEDFHCVAGWSATGLVWGGTRFVDLYRSVVEPRLNSDASVTHLSFRGADGYRSIVDIADVLTDDVLLATSLRGRPLSPTHGAPLRLVSPSQYGFVSTKYLCEIELHCGRPRSDSPHAVFIREHPRARVWAEERHAWFPASVIRGPYRALIPIIRWVTGRAR